MTDSEASPSPPLPTRSLRLRVTAVVTAVVASVVLVLAVAVDRVFEVQTERNLTTVLNGRAQLGRQLARSGIGPQQIVNRVSAAGVQTTLRLQDGTVLGDPLPSGPQLRTVRTVLPGTGRVVGATLILAVDTDLADRSQRTLRRILIMCGLAAIVLAALLVALASRYALGPLTTMARLATRIAGGGRGARLAPTHPDTDIGVTAVAFDAMLDELEGAEARALRSDARTRAFLTDAAHELRTPIAGVQAATEALLHQGSQVSAEEREQLEVLLIREARRAGSLVTDLLTAARQDAGVELELTDIDLAELARPEIDRVALVRPDLTVQVRGVASARVDADKIISVLRNLVDNAVRAVGEGGMIIIATRRTPAGAELLITDSGPGIPAADRERVFERLVRLDSGRDRDAGGSGLGLAIARGWARAHGGDLRAIDPPPGYPSGAAFLLTLP